MSVILFEHAPAASNQVGLVGVLRRLVERLDRVFDLLLNQNESVAWMSSDADTG